MEWRDLVVPATEQHSCSKASWGRWLLNSSILLRMTGLRAGTFMRWTRPWRHALVRQKPSTQRTMRYHVRKYLLPKWSRHPVECIVA